MVERLANGKVEYSTVREMVVSILTYIPEGLGLTYLNDTRNKDKHILVLMPDNSTNQCWWTTTHQLADTVRKIKDDLQQEISDIADESYRFALKSLKRGACKLFLWRVHSIHVLNTFKETIRRIVREKKPMNKESICMETWVARLKNHPEFSCVFSVKPHETARTPEMIVRVWAARAWRRVIHNEDQRSHKAHAQYARRNQDELQKPSEFEVFKVATYSTYSAYLKHRFVEHTGWIMPTKAVPPVMVCKHYTSNGEQIVETAQA